MRHDLSSRQALEAGNAAVLKRHAAHLRAQAAIVERGLIIQQPWIGLIADGKKTWEMRTRQTRLRGWIGLIEQGTGRIIGVAYLKASPPALRRTEHHLHYRKHRVKPDPSKKSYSGKYLFPWVLHRATRLSKPMKYKHPYSAVTWVKFSDEVNRGLARCIRATYPAGLA
jgi:hypothetical protein